MTHTHDIVIVGGGLAGRLLALTLAQRDIASTLIDERPADQPSRPDPRTTAIASGCAKIFEPVGLWEGLHDHACPVRKITVGDATRVALGDGRPADIFRRLSFAPDESSDGALAYLLRNEDISNALDHALELAGPVIWRRGQAVREAMEERGTVRLSMDDGETLCTRLVIACDGKRSPLRQRLGIRTTSWDYDQSAVAFTVKHDKDHQGTAQQFFLPGGPLALLPLTDSQTSVVWSNETDIAQALAALPEADFLTLLDRQIAGTLGRVELVGERHLFPLSFLLTPTPGQGRVVLCGEAAHVVHPIAGQGFNLTIKDIAVLTDLITESRAVGLDPGFTLLDQYAAARRPDLMQFAAGMDGLTRLLSTDKEWIRRFWGIGMAVLNTSDTGKSAVQERAVGGLGGGGDRLTRVL